MPFDLIGWAEAAPGTGTVGVTVAAGDGLNVGSTGDNIMLRPYQKYLLGLIAACESTPGYARLKQPSLDYFIESIASVDALGSTQPISAQILDLKTKPMKLNPEEFLTAYINNATDEDVLIGAWVGNGQFPAARGPFETPDAILRGTVDQTLTALTWTAGTVTWSQSLKAGKYAVIGLVAGVYLAANPGVALVRLTGLDGQVRPGVVANITAGDKVSYIQNKEKVFEWWPVMEGATFKDTAPPNIEALSAYADTDIVLQMAVKKVG